MPRDRGPRLEAIRSYVFVRKARWLLAVSLAIGVVVGFWGSAETSTPAATHTGGATVQFWRLLAVGSGSLPALTLVSPMDALEVAGGSPYHRMRSTVLAAAFAISSACVLTAAALGVDPVVLPLIARALLAWFGLSLISGRLLGWNYSWILPWTALCVLLYWGHSSTTDDYRWWEFTAQPIRHLPSALLAVGLFVTGVAAYAATSWRLRRLRPALGRPRRPRATPPPAAELTDCPAPSANGRRRSRRRASARPGRAPGPRAS